MRRIIALCVIIVLFPGSIMPAATGVTDHHSTYAEAPSDALVTLARLEPASDAYFGVNLDWSQDSAAAYSDRLGLVPATYVRFFRFPFQNDDLVQLEDFISQVAAQGGLAVVTLEPHDGLASVTPAVAEELAIRLAVYNTAGVPVFVQFAHEMNGSWYPWSQSPAEYRSAFRLIADAVHRRAPATAMLWAPNYGAGYPFHGGLYEAQPGSAAFQELDTNGDGVLSMQDDMYAPYYPGDDAVDWVGISLYHWGNVHPWGENEIPEDGKFTAQLRGAYNGLNGDERDVPDFYDVYATTHGKPLTIPDTAAFYNTTVGGASALMIKRAWWRQVFSAQTLQDLSRIKMINWFEWRKPESEVGGALIDWSITFDAQVVQSFVADLPAGYLLFATDLARPWRVYLPIIATASQ